MDVGILNQLKIEMLSMHANDDGSTENIHNLTETELAIRKVDMLDIAFDDVRHLSLILVVSDVACTGECIN